jgi:hypothetical protein
LELRRSRPYWGPRRLVFELAKRKVAPVPSESAAYRALVRAAMIDPSVRDRCSRKWKRWERGAPMELWQIDIVGGFPLVDGTSAKALTGVDDHSRMCVCATLMARERTRAVCDGLRAALARYGAPEHLRWCGIGELTTATRLSHWPEWPGVVHAPRYRFPSEGSLRHPICCVNMSPAADPPREVDPHQTFADRDPHQTLIGSPGS